MSLKKCIFSFKSNEILEFYEEQTPERKEQNERIYIGLQDEISNTNFDIYTFYRNV